MFIFYFRKVLTSNRRWLVLGSPLLSVKGLTKYYGVVRALNNVSFDLERGEILGIVGDNGSGKSTLLNILAGRIQPSGGKIFFDGREVSFRSPSDAMKAGISVMYQFLDLVESAPLWANFFMGRELMKKVGPISLLDKQRMKKITAESVEKYGFKIDVNREFRTLSGGQRRILAVVRAIEANPKLLLLDEPFTGLSERVIAFIKEIVVKAKKEKGISVIVATPWFDQVKDFIDSVIVLTRGEIMGRFTIETADRVRIFQLIKGLR